MSVYFSQHCLYTCFLLLFLWLSLNPVEDFQQLFSMEVTPALHHPLPPVPGGVFPHPLSPVPGGVTARLHHTVTTQACQVGQGCSIPGMTRSTQLCNQIILHNICDSIHPSQDPHLTCLAPGPPWPPGTSCCPCTCQGTPGGGPLGAGPLPGSPLSPLGLSGGPRRWGRRSWPPCLLPPARRCLASSSCSSQGGNPGEQTGRRGRQKLR